MGNKKGTDLSANKGQQEGLRAPLKVILQPWPRSAYRMTGQGTEGDSAPA